MRCRRCGHDNETGANFCSSCGHPLPLEDEATITLARALRAPRARRGAGRGAGRAARGHGHARGAARARSRAAGSSSTTRPPRWAATPTPTSSSTTSPCRGATRSSAGVDDGYEVSDVGSLNGTYVDHERVDTAPLHHLADLQIGRFVLVFLLGTGEASVSPEQRPTSRSGRCWRSSARSSPTSRSPRSGSSRARASSIPSARPRATGSSTTTTSSGCAGSSTSRRSTSSR